MGYAERYAIISILTTYGGTIARESRRRTGRQASFTAVPEAVTIIMPLFSSRTS